MACARGEPMKECSVAVEQWRGEMSWRESQSQSRLRHQIRRRMLLLVSLPAMTFSTVHPFAGPRTLATLTLYQLPRGQVLLRISLLS